MRRNKAGIRVKLYNAGDRVKLTTGEPGRVAAVIRRNSPPLFMYAVRLDHSGETVEYPPHRVTEPDRDLYDQWRWWLDHDLSAEYAAVLTPAQFARLQTEFQEVHPGRVGPELYEGVTPLHHVTVRPVQVPVTNISSNGAHIRRFTRTEHALRCTCGEFDRVTDFGRRHADRMAREHEDGRCPLCGPATT